jgi:solute carrier family 35, member F5
MAPTEPVMPAELAPGEAHHPATRQRSQSGDAQFLASSMSRSSSPSPSGASLRSKFGMLGVARRTLGIFLLLVTVFLWTVSNFLASVSFEPAVIRRSSRVCNVDSLA